MPLNVDELTDDKAEREALIRQLWRRVAELEHAIEMMRRDEADHWSRGVDAGQ